MSKPEELVNKNNTHAFLGGSDEGAVTGCTGVKRGGGYGMPSSVKPVAHGGPSGGYGDITRVDTCGSLKDPNLLGSKQSAPLVGGGSPVVGAGSVSEGSARVVRGELSPELANTLRGSYYPVTSGSITSQCGGRMGRVARLYKRAAKYEKKALESTDRKVIQASLKKMRKAFRDAEKVLRKMTQMAKTKHRRVVKKHTKTIRKHLKKTKSKKTRKHKGKPKRKHTRKHRSRKQKGGYHQFMGGEGYTPSMSVGAPSLVKGESWLGTTPPPYHKTNNCHGGSYNHFTGKSTPAPTN